MSRKSRSGSGQGASVGLVVVGIAVLLVVLAAVAMGELLEKEFVQGLPVLAQLVGVSMVIVGAGMLVSLGWRGTARDLHAVVPAAIVALCGALLFSGGSGAGTGLGLMGATALYLAYRGRADAAEE